MKTLENGPNNRVIFHGKDQQQSIDLSCRHALKKVSCFIHMYPFPRFPRFKWPQIGGFHKGGYPKMDGLYGKIPSRNGWWLGVPPCMETPQWGDPNPKHSQTPQGVTSRIAAAWRWRNHQDLRCRRCRWYSPKALRWPVVGSGSPWFDHAKMGSHIVDLL